MDFLYTWNEGKASNSKIAVSSILPTLLVFTSTALVCYQLWKKRWLYYWGWRANGPFGWPVMGSSTLLLGKPDDFLGNVTGFLEKYKRPVGIWLGGDLFFLISEPNDLEKVMNGALAKGHVYRFIEKVIGIGIFSSPVETWRKHRRVILPTFNQTILNSFVETFADNANILVQKLEQKSGRGSFDVMPFFGKCTMDIICETALGMKVHAQDGHTDIVEWIDRAMDILYKRIIQPWFHIDFIWKLSSLSSESDQLSSDIFRFMNNLVLAKKLEYRKKRHDAINDDDVTDFPRKKKAFLDYLLELSEKGEDWTDKELAEEALTMMMAGNDSTANMDSFAMVMLGMHPDIQAKVHEEIDDVLGSSDRNVTVDDLPKFRYLELVIKETLRLFPVGPIIARSVETDLKLDNFVLPKGSSVALVILHTHRNPEIWPDPLKFVPERFLPKESAKRHPYAYLPFSGGPRNCIGPRFANMSMKTVLATVLRRFKVRTDYKSVEDIKLKADGIIRCVEGHRISLEPRKKH